MLTDRFILFDILGTQTKTKINLELQILIPSNRFILQFVVGLHLLQLKNYSWKMPNKSTLYTV